MTQAQHDVMVAPIDHAYRVTAYIVTWALQLGYLAYVAMKWAGQDGEAAHPRRSSN